MQTQLIMVEGVPFSGKSTLSEFVAQQLELNGIPSRWVSEGVMLNQFFRHVLAILEQTQSLAIDSLRADWSAFVEAVKASPSTFVVDSALSYAALFPLMTVDRPQPEILAELKRVASACASLHPRVIHLTGDVDRITRASIVERGDEWQEHMLRQSDAAPYQQARGRSGLDGAIRFLEETQDLMHVALEEGGWQSLTLDVTATDWNTNRRRVLEFLGIAEVTVDRPVLSRDELQSYTGAYAPVDQEVARETLTVRMEHDSLALHGPRKRFGQFVPVSPTRFHVTATSLDAEFVVEDGRAQRLVVFTGEGKTLVYQRLA